MQGKKLCIVVAVVLFCSHVYAQTIPPLPLEGTIRDMAPVWMIHANYPDDWWIYNGWTDWPDSGGCGLANDGKGFNISADFEMPLWWYGTIQQPNAKGGVLYNGELGLVGDKCTAANGWTKCARVDSQRKPVYAHKGRSPLGTVQSPESFWSWWHDNPAVFAGPLTIQLANIGGRLYKYETNAFFPLDGKGWQDWNYGEDGKTKHNYAYCFEAHNSFTYYGGEIFNFIGDDDVWVYLDSRLIIDLGGVHTEQTASINLDQIAGLSKGGRYNLDFFYCERHTTLSKMSITTSINISCSYRDFCGVCEGDGQSCCTGNRAKLCDDGNACTLDKCAVLKPPEEVCIHTPINCDDGNKCLNWGCDKLKGCIPFPNTCNDGNKCTDDICINSTGCSYNPVTCTGDLCFPQKCDPAKGCVADTPVNCNDNDACTIDKCDPKFGCTYTRITCPSDKCNSSVCSASGGCVNTTKNCDDGNKCTEDSCDPSAGCVHVPIPCTPKDACTLAECTAAGGCKTSAKNCTDNNKCTNEICDLKAGCLYPPVPCDDANACTKDDCNPATGCTHTKVPCDDNSKCTDDSCDPKAGCLHVLINCDDKDACTNDTCTPADGCLHAKISCDDGNECTLDSCDPASGCKYAKKDCNDNNPCTADSCDTKTGCKHLDQPCNRCAKQGGGFVTCNPLNNDKCTPLDCDPATGDCTIVRNVTCFDNNKCTEDKCVNGECTYPPITCTDGKPCTLDSCDPLTGCKFENVTCDDKNPCTIDACNGTGQCVYTPKTCNTANPCAPEVCNITTGSCDPAPVSCNDDNLCTEDKCMNDAGKAKCVFTTKTCTGDACNPGSCNATTGNCYNTLVPCDDGNNCTNDQCVVKSGAASCAFTPITCNTTDLCNPMSCNPSDGSCIPVPIPCDDGNNCTVDSCAAGKCKYDLGGCKDFGLCIPALCDPKLGCQPAPSLCEDNNPCTIDECIGPMKCNHTIANCDDGDACTMDECQATSATTKNCTYSPVNCTAAPTPCKIYVGCSKVDGCMFKPVVCPEPEDYCTINVCNDQAGCVPVPRPCLVDDPDCYIGRCDSAARKCTSDKRSDFATTRSGQHDGLTCFAYYNKEELVAVITGPIIAVIVVAAVIFAVLAALGARQAYIWASLRGGAMGGASNNPMYAPSAANKENPLFRG